MIRIAVVEDELLYRTQINGYLSDYARDNGYDFQISFFADGLEISEDYSAVYDIIFMDISMKHQSGIEAAHIIRSKDEKVVIIFITNLAQFVLQGYEVEALSYVIKPVSYEAFAQELRRAILKLDKKAEYYLQIVQESNLIRIDMSEITFVESQGHDIVYHTKRKTYKCRDTLKNAEKKLSSHNFSRCNNCYLVNLAYVEKIVKNQVVVADEILQISRPRKKTFMQELAEYIGGL